MPDEKEKNRLCRWVMRVGLLVITYTIFTGNFLRGTAAPANQVFTDALQFYQQYGNRNLIFHEGAFYYGSKGKAGDPHGIRYGVSGQRFTFRLGNGSTYTVEVALDKSDSPGTCRRISYINKDGYYYSLYQILYDNLYNKLSQRYSWVEFDSLMYNHWIYVQTDFLLTCVRDGIRDGEVIEQGNGTCKFQGTIYETASQILQAAEWSSDTKNALPDYYGIQMNIYQPSVYYVEFHRNSAGPEGNMARQKFTYGTGQKLFPCNFRKEFQIDFDTLGMLGDGKELSCDSILLKSQFQGWALTIDGCVVYADQQTVQNLTNKNNEIIHLYARWEDQHLTFPMLQGDAYNLVGWCTSKLEIYKRPISETEVKEKKIYTPGSVMTPYKNMVFYAVWKKKNYRVQFENPYGGHTDASREGSNWQFHFGLQAVDKIRKEIQRCGFAGQKLNGVLVSLYIAA